MPECCADHNTLRGLIAGDAPRQGERMISKAELLQFMRAQRLAVEASVSPAQGAQAAVVGIAATDQFEIVFDTNINARKAANLRANPRVAFVLGGLTPGDERTVQYEGDADFPSGAELERLQEVYFEVWPNGRRRAKDPGLLYVRVRPTWIRFSDYNQYPPVIDELDLREL